MRRLTLHLFLFSCDWNCFWQNPLSNVNVSDIKTQNKNQWSLPINYKHIKYSAGNSKGQKHCFLLNAFNSQAQKSFLIHAAQHLKTWQKKYHNCKLNYKSFNWHLSEGNLPAKGNFHPLDRTILAITKILRQEHKTTLHFASHQTILSKLSTIRILSR